MREAHADTHAAETRATCKPSKQSLVKPMKKGDQASDMGIEDAHIGNHANRDAKAPSDGSCNAPGSMPL